MNQQQLQITRAALWRQNARPLVTFEEATAWLQEIGFCLFLPRHAQLPAPAPSFVEACSGRAAATPGAAAIEQAFSLAGRLVGQGEAFPLNLLGNVSEQPDFLATPEVLPWLAAVHGDRNWKSAPGGRTAPVVLRTWEVLDRDPGRTAAEIREIVGREVTEATVLRALVELWTTLRAVPDYAPGEPARWSLLKQRWTEELARGASTAQTTALSALISVYLRSAVAATGEEIEIFLSPLTARSRIREVVHGMMATRQLGTIALGVETLLFIEGSLPEVVSERGQEGAPAEVVPPSPRPRMEERHAREDFQKRRPQRVQGTGQRRESSTRTAPAWKKLSPGKERKPRFEKGEKKQEFAARQAPGRGRENQRWKASGRSKPWQKATEGRDERRPGSARFGRETLQPREPGAPETRKSEQGDRQRRGPFFREGQERRAGGFGGRGKPFRGNHPNEQDRGGFRGKARRVEPGSAGRRENRPQRQDRPGFQRQGKNRPARAGEKFEKRPAASRGGNSGEPRPGRPARFGPSNRKGAPVREDRFAGGGRPPSRGSRKPERDRGERSPKRDRKREKEKPE